MKKTYINPTLVTIQLKHNKPLMIGSDPNAGYDRFGSINPNEVESREDFFFDDDYEEEEW
jgi:hypothetical protein